jgi:hypothetical protein
MKRMYKAKRLYKAAFHCPSPWVTPERTQQSTADVEVPATVHVLHPITPTSRRLARLIWEANLHILQRPVHNISRTPTTLRVVDLSRSSQTLHHIFAEPSNFHQVLSLA